MDHPFTDEELIVILEAANLGIANGDIFHYIADKLDISDEEIKRIENKLNEFMNPEKGEPCQSIEAVQRAKIEGKIKLHGDQDAEIDALFDTGASRSIISESLAKELGRFIELSDKEQYKITKKDKTIKIIGKCNVITEVAGCRIPITTFEVTNDFLGGWKLVIGRPHLDEWNIDFTPEGPKPKRCPIVLELV